jgi:hypothetical protein
MRRIRSVVLGAAGAVAFSCVASADSGWQVVSLDNNPAFTIDIPASVGMDYRGEENEVLNFSVADNSSSIVESCTMAYFPYGQDFTRDDAIKVLGEKAKLCRGSAQETNAVIEHFGSATSSGAPAAQCIASYTDTRDALPGTMFTTFYIAAPDRVYNLRCSVSAGSQDAARAAWKAEWSSAVAHILKSLHLPAAER